MRSYSGGHGHRYNNYDDSEFMVPFLLGAAAIIAL